MSNSFRGLVAPDLASQPHANQNVLLDHRID